MFLKSICKDRLININTYKGFYKFKWLSFGIKIAPAIFQQAMLADSDFAVVYLDDISIKNVSTEQHIGNVKRVFEKYEKTGSNSVKKNWIILA